MTISITPESFTFAFSNAMQFTTAQKYLWGAAALSKFLITSSLLATLTRAYLPDAHAENKPPRQENKWSLIGDVFQSALTALSLVMAAFYSHRALTHTSNYCDLVPLIGIPDIKISPEDATKLFSEAGQIFMQCIQNSSRSTITFAALALTGTVLCIRSKTSSSTSKRWIDRFTVASLGLATMISLCTYVYAKRATF